MGQDGKKDAFNANAIFSDQYYKLHQKKFLDLAKNGQHPKTLYIGCSDSRVLPNLITQSGPGDLFVVRNIGNFVAPFSPDDDFHATASAIEYAISILKVENIIVCGHTHCGAIEALFDKESLNDPELIHTKKWLTLGDAPRAQALLALGTKASTSALCRLTEKLSVISQIDNLLTYPSVKKRVENGELLIHGWMYDITTLEVLIYNPENSQFEPIEQGEMTNAGE